MNINTKKNDKYTKYARIYPAVVAMLLPSMALTHYLYNLEIFKELFKQISDSWEFVILFIPSALIFSSIGYLARDFFRSISKILFQYPLFKEDETYMPTTDLLIYKKSSYSSTYIDKIMDHIEKDLGLKLKRKEEQSLNEIETRKEIANAVQLIRNKTRGDKILLQYNIEFGFCRNLMGGLAVSLIFTILLIISSIVQVTTNFGDREFLFSDIIAKNPHSWESGEYINYNLTISNETYQLSATPLEWTESPVNVIFDKQYYLKLSQTKVQTAGDGVTVNIEAKTNYDANPDTGYLPGASLNKSAMDTWPTVNMTQTSFSGGVYTYNIQVVMPGFNSGTGTKRETGFYINAGNLRHHVLLSQWKEDGEWLTSNVELDGSDGGTGNMQRRKLVFTSGNPGTWEWKITQIQDPDKILLNSETMLETSGVSGDVVYFYFRADAVSGDTATLTLTNTNGDNLPIAVTLTAP